MPPKQAHNNEGGAGHALKVVHNQLENLKSSGAITQKQYDSITAQLPDSDGQPSDYTDPNYAGEGYSPGEVAKSSQDPQHPSHPKHPQHSNWAKKGSHKVGNAALSGFGRSAGSALFNNIV